MKDGISFLPEPRQTYNLKMKYLALCFIALACAVHAAVEVEIEEDVAVLTDAAFADYVAENEFVLVEFCKSSILKST